MKFYSFSSLPESLRLKGPCLHRQTISLACRYAAAFYDSSEELEAISEKEELLNRLLTSWLFHWEKHGFAEDGMNVLQTLEREFEVSPLSDVVFSEALCERQSRAALYFQNECAPYLNTIGLQLAKLNSPGILTNFGISDWIGEFMIYLLRPVGVKSEPVLKKYRGFVGIRQWFAAVLVRYISNQRRILRKKEVTVSVESHVWESAEDRTARTAQTDSAHFEKLMTILRECCEALTPMECLRLRCFYRDRLTNLQIAAMLHEDPSLTTRRRKRAEWTFANHFRKSFTKTELYFWMEDLADESVNPDSLVRLLFAAEEEQE